MCNSWRWTTRSAGHGGGGVIPGAIFVAFVHTIQGKSAVITPTIRKTIIFGTVKGNGAQTRAENPHKQALFEIMELSELLTQYKPVISLISCELSVLETQ